MKKVLCKVVAVRAVGVKKVHRSLPIRCDAAGDRLVVRVVEDVKSGGAGEKVKVCITCKPDWDRVPRHHIDHERDIG